MPRFKIEFKHVEIYYADEVIEASSRQEAERIALDLLDSSAYQEYLMDSASYDDHEDEFLQAHETSERVSLTEREVKEMMED